MIFFPAESFIEYFYTEHNLRSSYYGLIIKYLKCDLHAKLIHTGKNGKYYHIIIYQALLTQTLQNDNDNKLINQIFCYMTLINNVSFRIRNTIIIILYFLNHVTTFHNRL